MANGDVLIGTSRDTYAVARQYRQNTEISVLETSQAGKAVVGMCASTDLSYLFTVASGNTSSAIVRFNKQGAAVPRDPNEPNPTWADMPYNYSGSCTTDRKGNVYVAAGPIAGASSQEGSLKRYGATGVSTSFAPTDIKIATSIDLSHDQCTMVYTAGGKIKRFDVCSATQLSDVAQTNVPQDFRNQCTFVRLRGITERMLVCNGRALLMSAAWSLKKRYEPGFCFAESVDAAASARFQKLSFSDDGQYFWALVTSANYARACRYNVETADSFSGFDVAVPTSILVYGEKTAASIRCMRLFGKTLCLVARFPYLELHDRSDTFIPR
jgi:hypothetical protein